MKSKKDNSGALFKNADKKADKSPDYTGNCEIAGVEYRIAAWINEGKAGKFMSLRFSPAEQPAARAAGGHSASMAAQAPSVDDTPF